MSQDLEVPVSQKFHEALSYASTLHKSQRRKGTTIPYVAHLLAVASIVMEAGGTETEAIAALLHDGPEDQGGKKTLAEIRARFKDDVADIVSNCSDTFEDPKPPWEDRKRQYAEHLKPQTKVHSWSVVPINFTTLEQRYGICVLKVRPYGASSAQRANKRSKIMRR